MFYNIVVQKISDNLRLNIIKPFQIKTNIEYLKKKIFISYTLGMIFKFSVDL